jgi:hypothetical protein
VSLSSDEVYSTATSFQKALARDWLLIRPTAFVPANIHFAKCLSMYPSFQSPQANPRLGLDWFDIPIPGTHFVGKW